MSDWHQEMFDYTESKIVPGMTPWEILSLGTLSRPVFREQLTRMEEWVDWGDMEKSVLVLFNGGASIRQIITMINYTDHHVDETFYNKLCDLEFSNYMKGVTS